MSSQCVLAICFQNLFNCLSKFRKYISEFVCQISVFKVWINDSRDLSTPCWVREIDYTCFYFSANVFFNGFFYSFLFIFSTFPVFQVHLWNVCNINNVIDDYIGYSIFLRINDRYDWVRCNANNLLYNCDTNVPTIIQCNEAIYAGEIRIQYNDIKVKLKSL